MLTNQITPSFFQNHMKGYRRDQIFACEFNIFTYSNLSHLRGARSKFIASIALRLRAKCVVPQKVSNFIFPSKIQGTVSLRYSTVVVWIVQPYKASVSYRWLQITTLCQGRFSVLFLAALSGKDPWVLKVSVFLNKSYIQQTTN